MIGAGAVQVNNFANTGLLDWLEAKVVLEPKYELPRWVHMYSEVWAHCDGLMCQIDEEKTGLEIHLNFVHTIYTVCAVKE